MGKCCCCPQRLSVAAAAAAAAVFGVTFLQAWVQEQLGADEVVDYSSADVAELYAAADKHFDIIIDCLVSEGGLYAGWHPP
jgi:NADPH-dependent curcumin reductase CurA